MSGYIDQSVIVAAEVTKEVVVGAVSIAAFVLASPIIMGIDIVNSLKEHKAAQQKLFDDNIKKQKQAFDAMKSRIQVDPKLMDEANDKMMKSINFEQIGVNANNMNFITGLKPDEKFKLLNTISEYSHYLENLDELLYLLNDEQVDISDIEKKVETITNAFHEAMDACDITRLITLTSEIYALFFEVRMRVNEINIENKTRKIEKIETILRYIENGVNMPYTYIFENELAAIIFETDEESSEALQDIQKYGEETLAIADKILGLNYIPNIALLAEEVSKLINSIFFIQEKDEWSINTKRDQIKVRYDVMRGMYAKAEVENKQLLLLKEQYDKIFVEIYQLENYLEMEYSPYAFNSETTEAHLELLDTKRKMLEEVAQKRRAKEQIRKAIYKAMRKLKYEHIVKNDNEFVESDIFHLGDGNIVTVTINDDESVLYFVSGVEMDGFTTNKPKIVKAQQTFCQMKKEIDQVLASEGVEIVKTNELIIPDEKYATAIKLPDHVDHTKLSLIRNAKVRQQQSESRKAREM